MRECLSLSLLAALCTAFAVDDASTAGSADDWREDLFLPGIKAQYPRQREELRQPFENTVREKQNSTAAAADSEVGEEIIDPSPKVSGLLKSSNDEKFVPRHEAWTYCAAFGTAGLFAMFLIAYHVHRGRNRLVDDGDEVCHYSRLHEHGGDDSSTKQGVAAAKPYDASDLDAERLVLQPLLEQAVSRTTRRSHLHSVRGAGRTDREERPVLKSLWSRIVRSSRELFVPEQFASGSTVKATTVNPTPNHATTLSTLPTIASRVESLQEMTEVEKTLWWRTM
ncbi:hypothetical protein HPB50_009019 [Hyalomma asiaticum]|uniref:Uncharacterized protein n=1 Tax=Hyalomma asiaticum TaxID=266040 RepID=A0ACB7SZ09_HYAAI|nr:hypothetical protein HPB50_009019 [Hyalomma asiaticum]